MICPKCNQTYNLPRGSICKVCRCKLRKDNVEVMYATPNEIEERMIRDLIRIGYTKRRAREMARQVIKMGSE